MKIIGWKKKGNLVRFALGNKNIKEYSFSDSDNYPYEHNADTFPDSPVDGFIDIAFYWDIVVTEPADDWSYGGNSPFCIENFKDRKAPILILYKREDAWDWEDYSKLVCSDNTDKLHKIYMGDDIKTVTDLKQFGEIIRSSTNV